MDVLGVESSLGAALALEHPVGELERLLQQLVALR